jgi:hypothetical protein
MNALVWISIILSPLLRVGVAVRADQLICPLLFVCCLIVQQRRHGKNPATRAIVFYALACAVASLIGIGMAGHAAEWSAIKWPLVYLTNVMAGCVVLWTCRPSPDGVYRQNLKIFQWLLFIVGLVGLLQVAEHRGLVRSTRVTDALSDFYPYSGELTEASFDKAFGRQLKVGGAGQLTSLVDGHPILAGDLLAFGLLITMPLARGRGWILHVVPIAALVLTLSRGSIIPWFFGVLVYFVLVALYSNSVERRRKAIVLRLASLVAVLALVVISPLGDSVRWRIQGSLDTLQGVGLAEGRTDHVWPEVFAWLQERTKSELTFGLSDTFDGPTDSQYLFTLVNEGVFGVVAFMAIHIYLLWRGHRHLVACVRAGRSPELTCAFLAAVCALLIIYTVHPACQNRRLLTVVVVTAMLLFQAAPKLKFSPSRKEARLETPRYSPLHSPSAG